VGPILDFFLIQTGFLSRSFLFSTFFACSKWVPVRPHWYYLCCAPT